MQTILREAEEKDVSAILAIINHQIINGTAIYDYEPHSYESQQAWFRQKQKDGFPVIVAVQNSQVIGFGTYGFFRFKIAYQYTVEHSIYIDHRYIRQGVGKLIMEAIINRARDEGYHVLIAGMDSGNRSSCEFHSRFGFEEVGVFRQVGFKFDRWLDLIFMQRLL